MLPWVRLVFVLGMLVDVTVLVLFDQYFGVMV